MDRNEDEENTNTYRETLIFYDFAAETIYTYAVETTTTKIGV